MSATFLPVSPSEKDISTMARTLYGEARGEGLLGMRAVAHVICNRARAQAWWGRGVDGFPDHSVGAVCRKGWQFSCWNADDPNAQMLPSLTLNDHVYRGAMFVALGVLIQAQGFDDPTQGSTHYHTHAVAPNWSEGKRPVCAIGRHLFYRGIA